jgi:two-component system, cell cycle sensor histidine kinase and response regulator CckA
MLRSEEPALETLTARTGAEALEPADLYVGPIDLVLSDVVLPGITGPVVARALAGTRPEARILFMSGAPSRSSSTRT